MPHLPRPLWLAARATLFCSLTGAGLWGLAQNPLALPLIERSLDSSARAIERSFRQSFAPEPEIRAALAAGDNARVLWLAELAEDEGVELPVDLNARIEDLRFSESGFFAEAQDCAVCAWDIARCESLAQIAACALPVELSPVGDVTALSRQAGKALSGQEVDQLETGLALVGLAATGAVVVSGGSSMVVKAGASALRSARRMGTLTPGLLKSLREATDLPVNWAAAFRAAPLDEITDTARLARLGSLAHDIGRIATNTSPAETLRLLRYIDGPEDAARLARVSDAVGARTLSRMEVLGKSRVFRATLRVSNTAMAAFAAIWAALTSLAMMLAGLAGKALLRALTPPPPPPPRRAPRMNRLRS